MPDESNLMPEDMHIVNKQLKDIRVGDKIVGPGGAPVTVTHVFDKYMPDTMYEITMDNGETIKCSGNHLWYCETDSDRQERKKYFKLAKYFFKHAKIPEYNMNMPAYPYEMLPTKFSDDKKCQELISRAALSLGPTYQTPNAIFDGLDYIKEEKFYTYSFNDMIDFLKGLQRVVNHDKSQYFYFGQVRETQNIAKIGIISNVNIPEKGDILHAN
jgi:preprotein translocase subunit YajC